MKSVLFGSDNSNPDNLAVSYNCTNATIFSSWTANQSLRYIIVPGAMTLTNYYLQTDAAPGLGTSYTFTIMKNGSATALEVTIADTATVGSDTTHSVSFAAGDTMTLRCTPTGTPALLNVQAWNALVQTNNQTAPMFTMTGSASTTVTNYGVMTGGHTSTSGWSATESDRQIIVPTAGTISGLYSLVSAVPGVGKSWQQTLMVNGAATSLQATIADTAITANDAVNSVAVVAGDTITIRSVPTGGPTSSNQAFSVLFTPVIDGESFFGFGHSVAPPTNIAYEQPLGLGNNAWAGSGSESARPMAPGPYTVTKMYVKINTAPGAGTSRTFTLRKAATSTALTVTIANANTTANVSANVTYAQADQMTLQSSVTGSPAAGTGGVHAGFLMYIAPDPVLFVPQIMIY
jgi:hypothetical protein